MESLIAARELAAGGRFADALATLDSAPVHRNDLIAAEVLRAQLLERVGRLGQSRALLQPLLRSTRLTAADRSACEFVLGRIELEDGKADSGLFHLQKSAAIAAQARNLERFFWSRMRCLDVISSRSGSDATTPLVAELHTTATKLGDPLVMAALHIHVGQVEAKRGLLGSAQRHTRLGLRTLRTVPNCWLEAVAENTEMNVAIIRSDFDGALEHGHRALQLAEQAGAASVLRASLANVGQVLYWLGRFEEAADHCERSVSALPAAGESSNAAIDSLAQIRLVQGRFEECAHLLDRVEQSIHETADRRMYTYRHSQLTRIRLLARQRRWTEALNTAESLWTLATDAGDHWLCNLILLTKAELLHETNRAGEFVTIVDGAATRVAGHSDLFAHYERILACSLAAVGHVDVGRSHFERAKRIYESLRNVPGLIELARCWDSATTPSDLHRTRPPEEITTDAVIARARAAVQSAVTVLVHAGRPELLAGELVHLLGDTACVQSAAAISRGAAGDSELLAAIGDPPTDHPVANRVHRFSVGLARDRAIEILVEPRADIESIATLNAVRLLLATIHDLERARAEREERLTLWPLDDIQTEDGQAVVSGQMRELMAFARRIATANVSVLITGESGTGKEILARAIHKFSDRAEKPFIPFNCTAVPRDVLESHLFGHRRGSFTGADRDHPGLIRSAREGTLFLDEIGDLSLDLQPKLLRFLESGEISPLGEPPLTVNVRVLAATNSDLEELVREGRFREDLFYRLNVIRLSVPPLRERRDEIPGLVHAFVQRAAEEFHKGQVRVADETMEYLLAYGWPGNIRQLHNELRRMVALADTDAVLGPRDLSADLVRAGTARDRRVNGSELIVPLHDKLTPTLSRIEREMIRVALQEHGGKLDAAARALGISRKGLYLKRRRLDL